jgi:PRTRC genetic system protein E
MELFKKMSEMLGEGSTLTITVAKKGDKLVVGVLPGNSLVKDSAKGRIVPLNLSGTPDELDNGFVEAIAAPVGKASGLLSDMASFEKAQEEAKEKSKMEAEKKAAEDKKKKEFAEWIELAKANLKEEKFRDALTCIAGARKIASDSDKSTLDKLEAEVAQSSGVGSMFGGPEDKSDGKNVKPGAKSAKTSKSAKADSDNEDEEGGDE